MSRFKLYASLVVAVLVIGMVSPMAGALALYALAFLVTYGRGVKAGYRRGFTEGGDVMVQRMLV